MNNTLHLNDTGGHGLTGRIADGTLYVWGYFDADGEIGFEVQRGKKTTEAYLSRQQVKQLRRHLKRVLKDSA